MTTESELKQLGQETTRLIRSSKNLSTRSETVRRQAVEKNREFERKRILRLKEILDERELGICSQCISDNRESYSVKRVTEKELGIFPKADLNFLYVEGYERCGSGYERQVEQVKRLLLLCPEHFPENPNRSIPLIGPGNEGKSGFRSGVFEREGKLYATINGEEITVRLMIDYPEEIFRYFSLSELPQIPYD
jgi:hypothetical protein